MNESPERFLLDTSALLCLIEDEDGAERVEAVLLNGQAVISWVSLLEIYYITLQRQGRAEADRRYVYAKRLPASFVESFDEPTLLTAGRFKAGFRLSLADAMIAAVAKSREATLLHKDPEFEQLSDALALEALPYKSTRE